MMWYRSLFACSNSQIYPGDIFSFYQWSQSSEISKGLNRHLFPARTVSVNGNPEHILTTHKYKTVGYSLVGRVKVRMFWYLFYCYSVG